jgi:hypothetical protein
MSFRGPRRISSLITPLALRELGMPADVAQLPEITAAWLEVAGADVAARVRPIRYRGGRLVLRATSAVWVSKLRHSHDSLIRQLRRHDLFRDLVDFEIRAEPLERATRRNPARTAPGLSAETRRLLDSVAADLDDPELRRALQRLGHKPAR